MPGKDGFPIIDIVLIDIDITMNATGGGFAYLSWSADKCHLSLLCQVLRQQCVVYSRLWFHAVLLSIESYNSQDYPTLLSIIVISQIRSTLMRVTSLIVHFSQYVYLELSLANS